MRKVSLPYAMTFEEAKVEALVHIPRTCSSVG